QFRKHLDTLVTQLDAVLKEYFDNATAMAQAVTRNVADIEAERQHITSELARVYKRNQALRRDLALLAPDRQHVQLLAASAVNAVSYVERLLPEAQSEAAIAMQAITGVTDFVETFKENPGRRLISIFAGAAIGLPLAWSLGLDVFQAVLTGQVT